MNLSLWQRHREQIRHPATTIKSQDLDIARTHIERHEWAKSFLDKILAEADKCPDTTPAYLEWMVPRETPNSPLFTMCPACEGAPVHGNYHWNPDDPDRLICTTCNTAYPNPAYPEDFILQTDFGGGQTIPYYAGKHWDLIGFPFVSSWTANIRARKCSHMAGLARRLGMAYALTGNAHYAQKARDILLRFAQVYPGYMVHSGYGEFSDLSPEIASQRILDLPKPELVVPPNKPNHKLHVGYWMAGRATGVGMEGTFVADVVVAYDLTCQAQFGGNPVYTSQDRLAIERDLLLESTILLCADPGFNNKSATNRSAAGLVGLCLGEPELVRFGMEGFRNFTYEWFLQDGLSSESPGYGFMTLSGIRGFADALHGYTDPEGYEGPDGRIEKLDIYGDSRYRAVLDGYVHSLMPDLGYGVIADDNTTTRMPIDVADMLASRYGAANHIALLAELCGHDLSHHGGEYALFHRDPNLVENPEHSLSLSDHFFPALRIGLLRTGVHGRASTALLSASDWGNHHHEDSLNLVYWKDGYEALTDLGYLWDRPDKHHTVRTIAHNTVVVDNADQKRKERGGSLDLFDIHPRLKLLQVSSRAYDIANTYRRTCLIVDHGERGSYLIDVFHVQGGNTHDYLFHGPVAQGMLNGLAPVKSKAQWQDLKNLMEGQTETPWSMVFKLGDQHQFTAYALPQGREQVFIGDGWGERGTGSRDHIMTGETVPYVIRRNTGHPADSAFASVFEVGLQSRPFVLNVQRLAPTQGQGVGMCITTAHGRDLVAVCLPGQTAVFETPCGPLETSCQIAAFSLLSDNRLDFAYVIGGTRASLSHHSAVLPEPVLQGAILEQITTPTASYYRIDQPTIDPALLGKGFMVEGGAYQTAYPVRKIEPQGQSCLIFTKTDGLGYDAIEAKTWKIMRSASLSSR